MDTARLSTPPAPPRDDSRRTTAGTIIVALAYVVLIAVALIMFVPFLYSVATSFKTPPEASNITIQNMFWPQNPTLDAYRIAFESNIVRWFLNSTFVAIIWIIGRITFATLAGYAFARMDFPGRNLIFTTLLATMMVPGIVLIIPRFMLLQDMGLLNTYGALTVPYLVDVFGIFLMKQFFESIPIDLEEAARMDGASRYQIFRTIVLPNAIPAVSALAIFSFQGSWNNFLEPIIYITGGNTDLYTLPVGLANFRSLYLTNWPVLMAIAVITTVPMAIFFLVFQRFFIEGHVSSGIKG